MAIEDWFYVFLVRHLARHPRQDWPDLETEGGVQFFLPWKKNFVLHGLLDEDVAHEASERLMAAPPRFLDGHLPGLLKLGKEIYVERNAEGRGVSTDTREAAELASKGCFRCGLSGLTTVYHPRPNPEQKIPPSVAAYCECPIGRWVERNHRESSPDLRRRIPDLIDVLGGRSCWRVEAHAAMAEAAASAPDESDYWKGYQP